MGLVRPGLRRTIAWFAAQPAAPFAGPRPG